MASARKQRDKSSPDAPLLGAHVSTAGGLARAIDRACSIGCTAMQIFVKNNMQWFAPPLTEDAVRDFSRHAQRDRLRCVFAHSGYLINLAAMNDDFHEKSLRSLREELVRADQLDLPFLVLHPGAHMGAGIEAGLDKVVAGLDQIFTELPRVKTRVALETTAGQGSSLGHDFAQIAYILKNVRKPARLCVCIDTAHLFAAGYDIATPAGIKSTFADFKKKIGFDRLAAIHVNDSKAGLGSRVDRHEHIGKGRIGLAPFRYIMREPLFAGIPKVLETPKGADMAEDVVNMATLRALA